MMKLPVEKNSTQINEVKGNVRSSKNQPPSDEKEVEVSNADLRQISDFLKLIVFHFDLCFQALKKLQKNNYVVVCL